MFNPFCGDSPQFLSEFLIGSSGIRQPWLFFDRQRWAPTRRKLCANCVKLLKSPEEEVGLTLKP
jgi:hypothetical protein